MQEEFVQFVWHHGLFKNKPLKTIQQGDITLFDRGLLNIDSGPDFTNARIKINNQDWAGSIEVHIKASDWKRHQHAKDQRYDSVILHVVWSYDHYNAQRHDGSTIPTLELKSLVEESVILNYKTLFSDLNMVPCTKFNPMRYDIQVNGALHRAIADRMIQKSAWLLSLKGTHRNDWQKVFYMAIARYLGMRVNADAMQDLACRTPNDLLAKNKNSKLQLEALLFGQSGFLDAPAADEYHAKLKQEYTFLKKKYDLTSMSVLSWKFSRMRPANFPTVRISQLAALIHKQSHLFSKVIQEKNVSTLKGFFAIENSNYWCSHYKFGVLAKRGVQKLGAGTIESVLINVVAPLLFAYGKHRNDEYMKERAFDLLELLKPEDNKFTRCYKEIGFSNETAYDSQAIMGLRENYCEKRRCLQCSIGIKILDKPE